MKRVVITGIGALSPLGRSWAEVVSSFESGISPAEHIPEWEEYEDLRSPIGGRVKDKELSARYDRKRTRSMSRAAILATQATEMALTEAELLDRPEISGGEMGVAYGSCLGGTDALLHLASACARRAVRGIPASSYVQVMSHSCAASISLFFSIRGRLIPTCSACTSGSQAIGFAYETIRSGAQKLMVAGGAEELSIGLAALFDAMCATTKCRDVTLVPRPFDRERDGIVLSEGACTFVLEELEHALARGAKIIAEIVGFGTNAGGMHITDPDVSSMEKVLTLALNSASLPAKEIGFVHMHGTATLAGDIAESQATFRTMGGNIPVGALKSLFGHTLGAAGSLESWGAIQMMRSGLFLPIRNLFEIDDRCAPLNYLTSNTARLQVEHVMCNNFAFGGVNTSLIFRRFRP